MKTFVRIIVLLALTCCLSVRAEDWSPWVKVSSEPAVRYRTRCGELDLVNNAYHWDVEFENTSPSKWAKIRVYFYRKGVTGKWDSQGNPISFELPPNKSGRRSAYYPDRNAINFRVDAVLD